MSDSSSTKQPGRQIRVFLTDGSPLGIQYAELVNWTGQAFSCPKNLLPELKDWGEQTQRPGVYILLGIGDRDDAIAYIGESDDVLRRLVVEHYAKPPEGMVEITQALLFTSKDENLTKGHITFLEERLQDRAKKANKIQLIIGRAPSEKNLSRPEEATMNEFLQNIYVVAATLGYTLFELPKKKKIGGKQFKLSLTGGVTASGYLVGDGFLVEAGSFAVKNAASSLYDGYKRLRKQLVTSGVLKSESNKYQFTADCTFQTSSAAVCVIAGSQRSGPASWHDDKGKTLGDFEASKAKKANSELTKQADLVAATPVSAETTPSAN